mmetsp:Transcript_18098/g.45971  ORF Transcript_18098/g.45971 Transcript_18098/m.45971 type:complete len:492 (+) Transcript_18098:96-1571(+)
MSSSNEELLRANAPDAATQAARLAALNGKTCLWITAPVIPMMSCIMTDRIRWATAQGVEICAVFSSEEDKLYAIMNDKQLFSRAIFADLNADDVADRIIAAVKEAGVEPHSVFSPYEQCQTIVGDVGTKLGLMANPAKAYSLARSKDRTRVACREAGLPTPRSGVCSTVDGLEEVLAAVGYPSILKPASGAGSAGVYRASSIEEAKRAFKIIEEDFRKNSGLSWNPGLGTNKVLVEELLVGPEFDVDILMWEGEAIYVRTVDNWECIPPYFLETGSNQPSVFPKDTVADLEKYSIDCVRALGFTFGCFHVESIITAEGPRLIEVNARQGGGSMQEFNMGIHDVDIFANFFIGTFGIPINPPVTPSKCAMADYSITCPRTGILEDLDFLDRIREHPNVTRVGTFCKPGDRVTGYDSGFPIWIGEFVVSAETPEAAIKIVDEIKETLTFNIRPESGSVAASDPSAVAEPATEQLADAVNSKLDISASADPASA